ncbi:MAG: immunoglobulin-like domain-containing protein [Patescibacteria group bacterium]
MKRELANKLRRMISNLLILLMIIINFGLAPFTFAEGEILTIESEVAYQGDLIIVPIIGSSFTLDSDVFGIQFKVNYDNTLLQYTGYTAATTGATTVNNVGNYINVVWDSDSALVLNNESFISLNFEVFSTSSAKANLTFSNTEVVDSNAEPLTISFIDGEIILNPDYSKPTLREITPAPTPTNDNTPSYTFNSSEAGTISYGGGCTSAVTDAVEGNNTITFNELADGTYSSCTISVTDLFDNTSEILNISEFTIDTVAPALGDLAYKKINGEIKNVSPLNNQYALIIDSSEYADLANNLSEALYLYVEGADSTKEFKVYWLEGDQSVGQLNYKTLNSASGWYFTVEEYIEVSFTTGQNTFQTIFKDEAGNETPATLNLTTVDTANPIITILGNNLETIEVGASYIDPGATALDDLDGNISSSIVIGGDLVNVNILGTYIVTYNVKDSAGNSAMEVSRTVKVVDTTAPIITLKGSNPITIVVGSEYNDPGAMATDNYDNDLTASIIMVNPVMVNIIGKYIVTYNIADSSSNQAIEVTRTVNVVDATTPIITLLGENPVTIEVGAAYNDAGATAVDDVDGDITANIIVINNVNTNILGTYTVTYNVFDSSDNPAVKVTRIVHVVDTTAPVIALLGNNPANVEVGYQYNDAGATASDNYDGDLTANIIIINLVDINAVGAYTVTYNITDSSGNSAVAVIRTVNVTPDVTAPVITLNGGNMTIYKGTKYNEPGAKALDNLDGNISAVIVGGDTVDENTPGVYMITYNVLDSAKNAAIKVTRTVTVLDFEEGQATLTPDISVSASSSEIMIGSNAPESSNIAVPISASNARLNLIALISGTDAKIAILPSNLVINSETNLGKVDLEISAGTQISGETSWNGTINLPQIKDNSSVTVLPDSGYEASVSSVIEIGYGDVLLTFDKAVRIKLAGQTGKYIGYSRNNVFTPITTACGPDSQEVGDALPTGGNCKIDAGSDLVIWTKHFTKFVSYSQTAQPILDPPGRGVMTPGNTVSKLTPEKAEVIIIPEKDINLGPIKEKEVKVLGFKINYRAVQLDKIASEAEIASKGAVNLTLESIGKSRNVKLEVESFNRYTLAFIKDFNLSAENIYAINNYIVYGTETTSELKDSQRASVLYFYKLAFNKLPSSKGEWEDILKITNGRWPSERSLSAEDKAKKKFEKIYLRKPDLNYIYDNAAVTIMAYGLLPTDRNLDSEKAAIKIFQNIFAIKPSEIVDWNIVHSIAYSGATR